MLQRTKEKEATENSEGQGFGLGRWMMLELVTGLEDTGPQGGGDEGGV